MGQEVLSIGLLFKRIFLLINSLKPMDSIDQQFWPIDD